MANERPPHSETDPAPDSPAETAAPEQEETGKASDPASENTGEIPSEAAGPEEAPDPAAEMAALNDKLLRALAELENTRRRAEKDRIDAQQYGMMRFARDMLAVADNLGRALAALPEESRADLPDGISALLEGVAATERDLLAIFERHQIVPIAPMGEKFDPNFHEAMFEAPGTGQPAGTVIEVIEAGYRIGERLLRPARVGVAKADD